MYHGWYTYRESKHYYGELDVVDVKHVNFAPAAK